ncbi:MAG: hypothetical protein JJT85_06160 [Chromatiales bacterium]|nr:hypothetical protein [Chromatiales bacterium]
MSTGQGIPVGVTAPASRWASEHRREGRHTGRRLLRHIAIITHCVADIGLAESSWSEWLGYRTVASGRLGDALCRAWDSPAAAGSRWRLMQPASGANCLIRFIESPAAELVHSQGWNATELLVQDPDSLARQLADGSPFSILGGPCDLYPQARAPRAMQTRGPNGELVYFTRILPGGSRYGMKGARSPVDRAFIVTTGGPSLEAMQDFYAGEMGLRVMDRMPFLNPIMADACGVSPRTVFPTSVARIPGRSFLVEMDEYPEQIPLRKTPDGGLPPGMAMVAFELQTLTGLDLPLRSPPTAVEEPPYAGRRVSVTRGAAGEWLELIEGLSG